MPLFKKVPNLHQFELEAWSYFLRDTAETESPQRIRETKIRLPKNKMLLNSPASQVFIGLLLL